VSGRLLTFGKRFLKDGNAPSPTHYARLNIISHRDFTVLQAACLNLLNVLSVDDAGTRILYFTGHSLSALINHSDAR